MINYYEVLEVNEKATEEVIEKVYKFLAKKYHPDLQKEEKKKEAEDKMKLVNEAYEILSDKAKREEYDAKLKKYRENEEKQRQVNNNYNKQQEYRQKQAEAQKNEYNYEPEQENNNYDVRQEYEQKQKNYDNYKEQYYEEEEIRRQEIREQLQREAERRYAKAYEDYLRSLGYKIKYKWTWERIKSLLVTILIFIVIGIILWIIPLSRNFLIELYEENFIIKIIVDVINNLISALLSIFKS